jgi:hypothetical protein
MYEQPTNVAMVQRAASYAWEAQTVLLATVATAGPIKISFPRPVIILGAYPSVAVQGGLNTLDAATVDDIMVRIDVDTGWEKRLTSRQDVTQPNGIGNLPDVTLGSFRDSMGGARVMNYVLGENGSHPELQISFSWKRDITGGPWFRHTFVALTFLANFQ